MYKSKTQLQELINEIVTGGKYTANELRLLLTDMKDSTIHLSDSLPSANATWSGAHELTVEDIHKLCMVKKIDGIKTVMPTQKNGGSDEVKGKWTITVYEVLIPPVQAEWLYTFVSNPVSGFTFMIDGVEFTAKEVPVEPTDFLIGANETETRDNALAVIATQLSDLKATASAFDGTSFIVTAGRLNLGAAGNSMINSSSSSTYMEVLLQVEGVNNFAEHIEKVAFEITVGEVGSKYYFEEIFKPSNPAGVLIAGYRWPETVEEFAVNMEYVINNNDPETASRLIISRIDNVITLEEIEYPDNIPGSVTSTDELDLVASINMIIASQIKLPSYVDHPIIGWFVGFHPENGQPMFSRGNIYDVKLGGENPVEFDDEHPSNLNYRIGIPGDDGTVEKITEIGLMSEEMMMLYFSNGLFVFLSESEPEEIIRVMWHPIVFEVKSSGKGGRK